MGLDDLTKRLQQMEEGSRGGAWPVEGLHILWDAGCFRAAIPTKYGGNEADPLRRVEIYEAVAAGSLSLALILTQHDGACELLARSDNAVLADRLLPRFASGDLLTTVGISQLTTSRRGKAPAMQAEREADGFKLTGVMPWVTSAKKADYIVTGAVLPDDQQILACVSGKAKGLRIDRPMELLALSSSWTSAVRCEGVQVTPDELICGPVEQALAIRAPVKSLTVSSVGIGVAGALLAMIGGRASTLGDDFQPLHQAMKMQHESARAKLRAAAQQRGADPDREVPAQEIRTEINDLVTRLAASCLTLAKGSGYASGHPAEKLVREALFFLVWSVPVAVQLGTLRRLWAGQP